MTRRPSSQSGNILFLILLAIILFVALTYAVNSGMRGGGNNASKETIQSEAANILQFLDTLDTAVWRMRITEGIKPENISFQYDSKKEDGSAITNNTNPNCSVDSCKIFKPSGGGVPPREFFEAGTTSSAWLTSFPLRGSYNLYVMQFPYAGTDANDIVISINGLDIPVCNEINRALSIAGPLYRGGTQTAAGNPVNWDTAGFTITGSTESLLGKSTVSLNSGTNYCYVYHVVFAR